MSTKIGMTRKVELTLTLTDDRIQESVDAMLPFSKEYGIFRLTVTSAQVVLDGSGRVAMKIRWLADAVGPRFAGTMDGSGVPRYEAHSLFVDDFRMDHFDADSDDPVTKALSGTVGTFMREKAGRLANILGADEETTATLIATRQTEVSEKLRSFAGDLLKDTFRTRPIYTFSDHDSRQSLVGRTLKAVTVQEDAVVLTFSPLAAISTKGRTVSLVLLCIASVIAVLAIAAGPLLAP